MVKQRLTSLHRVFNDHPEAQIVFNVETEAFQNQSAATRKDSRYIKVYDLIRSDVNLLTIYGRMTQLGMKISDDEIGRRLQRVAAIPKYSYHMEIITDLPYEEVAQIFVRVNSGGRALKTTDLALATLSARWPGVLAKLEGEAEYWRQRGYGDLDVTFLTRALTGAVVGRGLSAWSHSRLAAATDEELEQGWATVQAGLRQLVPLLKNNLKISHSSLLTSINVLLPLVVLLGERPKEKLDEETVNGILYWFLIATIRNRYSSGADTLLGQDIPAARKPDPVNELIANLGLGNTRIEISPQALVGRTVGSPYFFLSFLVAQENGAKDWFHGAGISADADGGHKIEYHHIHPRATLKEKYSKAEINDLANLAFISSTANKQISNKSPAEYFPSLTKEELTAHFVPLDEHLRTADAYREFLAARRALLAEAMTKLVDKFRPKWLDDVPAVSSHDIEGCSLEFVWYESRWDEPKLVVDARAGEHRWHVILSATAFEEAISQAQSGISGDIEVGGQQLAVRSENGSIEVEFGPLLVVGTDADWKSVIEREKADALPLSQAPVLAEPATWDVPRRRFPVTSSD